MRGLSSLILRINAVSSRVKAYKCLNFNTADGRRLLHGGTFDLICKNTWQLILFSTAEAYHNPAKHLNCRGFHLVTKAGQYLMHGF
jgi:hypothetical protein